MNTKYKLNKDNKVIVLTGAGISAESGLKTFRDHDGLWENHHVEEVATPQAFAKDPGLVWKFYKERYFQLTGVKPNKGHLALVELEKYLETNFMLITQNVDGLHQIAGNQRVIEMHGSLKKCFCTKCGGNFMMQDIDLTPPIPICGNCGGKLRPDIVWFGEIPYYMNEIDLILKNVTYFIVAGTSGTVHPAAGLVYIAKMNGAQAIGINLNPPENILFFDEFHQGKSGEILPKLIKYWLS